MKRTLLAVAILAFGMTSSSFAADIARAPVYKAAPVAPAYNWSGFYAGVMGGWATGDGNSATFGSADVDGGFLGGTLGVNWQAPGSPWVWGVEADLAWADIGDSVSATVGAVTGSVETDLDWFGTARLRGGYA